MPKSIPPLFLSFCILCLVSGLPARAERKPAVVVGAAPPQPVQMALKVRREGKTEIPLRIIGLANEPLKFLIRVPPEHGRLSEPRQTEREAAVVVYEPPADLSITTERFSYAVQNSIGVSAAVDISLTIIDQPPQLSFPDTLDFGTIRAGASSYRLLEVGNHGGLIATGEVIVDGPWKIEGKSGYRLHAGDVAVFKIIFEPNIGGDFEGVARYTSEPEHSTTLRGVAQAVISANPAEWTLQQSPGDTARTGLFELSSVLDEPRTLSLKTSASLKIPSQVTLPPHGKARVTVEASPDDVRALDTEIRLEGTDFSIGVPVHVPGLSAVLKTTAPAITFGRLAVGQDASQHFELENIGGAPGAVTWAVEAPFRVPVNSATVQAGEKKSFAVEIDTKKPGRYRTWLQFKVGGQAFDLPVQGEVVAAPSSMPSMVSTAGSSAVTGSADSGSAETVGAESGDNRPEALDSVTMPDWIGDPIPQKGVGVHHITPTSAIIEWPRTLSAAVNFRVEIGKFQLGTDGNVHVAWEQPSGVHVAVKGENYSVALTNLVPSRPWTVRVLTLRPDGAPGPRLFGVDFQTPPKVTLAGRFANFSQLQWLVILFLALLAWQIWERWRQRSVV